MYFKKLTRKGFTAWLESKSRNAVVGKSLSGESCPIANYVNEVIKTKNAVVTAASLMIFHPNRDDDRFIEHTTYRLPVWAEMFIKKIDGHGSPKIGSSVSTAKALLILRSI